MKNSDNTTDPATTYNKPSDLLADSNLSRDEKIKLLKEWEYNLRQIQAAQEENMLSGPDVDLKDVVDALNQLNVEAADTGSSKI